MHDTVYVGLDWSEHHHDVCVVADEIVAATLRIDDTVAGIERFHAVLADFTDDPARVVIATETDRGLFIGALIAAGYRMIVVNPLSMSRYRDRHTTSGAKSDAGDARVLADIARTDAHAHRHAAADSDLADAVKTIARAHQNLIWARHRQVNQLRATLREFYPAALAAFGTDLASADAIAVLTIAPTPDRGRRLSRSKIAAALRRGGRQRRIDDRAAQIHTALRSDQLAAPPAVADAMGHVVAAQVAVIGQLTTQIHGLHTAMAERFDAHPDAQIVRSLPGLGTILGARVLGEFGDDPNRYATAKSRKNYAGTSPITRASGTSRVVLARYARNSRLADACSQWAMCAITASPGARAHYDRQRARGATHHQALRTLANRLVGILHGCLRYHTPYDEHTAWGHRIQHAA